MSRKDLIMKECYLIKQDIEMLEHEKKYEEDKIISILSNIGIKSASYSDAVIKLSGVVDKYTKAYISAEKATNRRDEVVKELELAENTLNEISKILKSTTSLEYKVFNERFINGKKIKSIANELKFSEDRIKQISSDLKQKILVNK